MPLGFVSCFSYVLLPFSFAFHLVAYCLKRPVILGSGFTYPQTLATAIMTNSKSFCLKISFLCRLPLSRTIYNSYEGSDFKYRSGFPPNFSSYFQKQYRREKTNNLMVAIFGSKCRCKFTFILLIIYYWQNPSLFEYWPTPICKLQVCKFSFSYAIYMYNCTSYIFILVHKR